MKTGIAFDEAVDKVLALSDADLRNLADDADLAAVFAQFERMDRAARGAGAEPGREPLRGGLEHLFILDFSSLLPGPFATGILADLGANVLKITSASRPDLIIRQHPVIPGSGMTAAEALLLRGKRSMFLNLAHPEAVKVVERLLARHDILMEAFRPGAMEHRGLGYDALARVNPRLIYCSLTGYGQDGPLSGRASHDINYLARSGLAGYSGRAGQTPDFCGMPIGGVAAGSMFAAVGILAAVAERAVTGRGKRLDVSMMDGLMAFHGMRGASYFVDGIVPQAQDHLLTGRYLYDYYETADGRFLSVGAAEPVFWERFCKALGREDLIEGGIMREGAVKDEVRALIKGRPLAHWQEVFEPLDACVEPVLSLDEAVADAHARHRKTVRRVALPDTGQHVEQTVSPLTPADASCRAWPTGHHTREVMLELGYLESDIAALRESGLFS